MKEENQIAIIGMSGIFPEAENISEFARNLRAGKDSVRKLSPVRMAITRMDPYQNYQVSGFVDRLDVFDYKFFNLSKREAEQMDPAHRMVLELSCQAIWDAGYSLKSFSGSNTGVYVGGKSFPKYLLEFDEPDAIAYSGNLGAMVAGRISYHLNLLGPTLMIDTSCSSSLVAVHEACQKLISEEIDTALSGGFGYITHFHNEGINNSLGIMSPEGTCRTFDASANGIGVGEGGGMLLLKRLDKALKDGDIIHSVIIGSAVNHDGQRSNGLTAPSPKAQTEVIVKAWKKSGINPESIGFIEAHGTGTNLGDPIEFKGITDAFAQFTDRQSFCGVSAVKSNIGHLDNAAGVASLIKTTLSLKNGERYPSIHFKSLNPFIESDNTAIYVNQTLEKWDRNGDPRRGGINSFGLSGTNVHAVLEQAPEKQSTGTKANALKVIKLSAWSKAALLTYKQSIQTFLETSDIRLEDICYTLNSGRDDYAYRLCLPVDQLKNARQEQGSLRQASITKANENLSVTLLFSDNVAEQSSLLSIISSFPDFSCVLDQFLSRGLPLSLINSNDRTFLLQVGLYAQCRTLKIPVDSIIAWGIGKISKQYVLDEISAEEAVEAILSYQDEEKEIDISKLERLAKSQLENESLIFLNAGTSNTNVLGKAIEQLLSHRKSARYLSFLDDDRKAEKWICDLYTIGVDIDWSQLYDKNEFERVIAPAPSFEKESCWVKKSPISEYSEATKLLYHQNWGEAPLQIPKTPAKGNFIIVAEQKELSQPFVEELVSHHIDLVLLVGGQVFDQMREMTDALDLDNIDHIKQLGEIIPRKHQDISGLIFIDGKEEANETIDEIWAREQKNTTRYLRFCQAFDAYLGKNDFVVAHITLGITQDNHLKANPVRSADDAFFRSLIAEHPTLKVKNIALSHEGYQETMPQVLAELLADDPLVDIRLINGRKYVKSVEGIDLDLEEARESLTFKNNAVYLITGGAEGIGFEVAKALAFQTECTFIMLGRTILPSKDRWHELSDEKSIQKVNNLVLLETMGAHVTYYAVDVSQEDAMKDVFVEIAKAYDKIDGIIHSAGTGISGIPLAQRKEVDFLATRAPKVHGTLLLDSLTKDLTPDFFVCFSSVNVLLPARNSASYSLANAFMDSWCSMRNHESSTNYISIQWSPWKDTGMILKKKRPVLDDSGAPVKFLSAEDGVQAFFIALATKYPVVTVGNIDFKQLTVNPYFITNTTRFNLNEQDVHPQVLETSSREEVLSLEQKLLNIWYDVLKEDNITVEDDFFDIGGNSLNGAQLIRKINNEFDLDLDFDAVFEYGTINELIGIISELKGIVPEEQDPYELKPIPVADYYDLSHSQKRLWILSQFEEDSIAYNLPAAYQIEEGDFDISAFETAVQLLVDRHESLRTVFKIIDGEPKQHIIAGLKYNLQVIDLSDLSQEAIEAETQKRYKEEVSRAFDLENGPLFTFIIVKQKLGRYVIIYNVHHIISDGWSQGVLINDLLTAYNAAKEGKDPDFKPLQFQYKDYSNWHNEIIKAGEFDKLEKYWLDKFQDKPTGIDLPLDFTRPAIQTFNGKRLLFKLNEKSSQFLEEMTKEKGTTIFMNVMAVLGVLLHKYTGQSDIILGSPSAGRSREEFQDIVGFFVNTLVFRWSMDPSKSFDELLDAVKKEALEVYNHQDFPFDLLIEKIGLERSLSHSPIFNVLLAHNNTNQEEDDLAMEGVETDTYAQVHEFNMSKFDLIFFMAHGPSGTNILLEYNSDLFSEATMGRMAQNFITLADNIAENPTRPLGQVSCLAHQEYQLVTRQFQGLSKNYSHEYILSGFHEKVLEHPEATALVFNDTYISYAQLNTSANKLAHYLLQQYGIGRGAFVGISMHRSTEMIIGILAILKSGAAYVSIDPDYPLDRQVHMLADSQTKLLLADTDTSQLTHNFEGTYINVIKKEAEIDIMPDLNPEVRHLPDDVAYVIYTSGSTGTPNGALLSHGQLNNLIQWQIYNSPVNNALNTLQFTSINFCVSFQEIMVTLCAGGKVCLIGDIERQDVNYLMDFIQQERIGNLYLPFSYLNFLFNEFNRWRDIQHELQNIITAGEQLKITTGLKKFLDSSPGLQLHNHYGSSEMHVVTSHTLNASNADDMDIPPAGKPIANHVILILDEFLNPVPIGVFGELYVFGATQFNGYINNEGLTDKKLVSLPGFPENQKFYKSGDVGKWLEDGSIQLKGRKDDQVKIRGFRVELGEIESRIYQLDEVKECVVVVREDRSGQKTLVAYLVLSDSSSKDHVKAHLSESLPQYMVPFLVELEALPLMPNGKVDRENLPVPEFDQEVVHESPRNETEQEIHDIWCEVLGKSSVSISDNFFEIGGHSIKASQVVNRISDRKGKKVTLFHLFKNPTIKSLAELYNQIEQSKESKIEPVGHQEYYKASKAQMRIWIGNQYQMTDSSAYNMFLAYLLEGDLNVQILEKAFLELIQRHESLRTSFMMRDDVIYQKVIPVDEIEWSLTVDHNLTVDDLSTLADFSFNLEKAPLIRASLVPAGAQKYVLGLCMHHIISDGWSLSIAIKELVMLYNYFLEERTNGAYPLEPISIQYKDYAAWEARIFENGFVKEARDYWSTKLEGVAPHAVELPSDFPRPQKRSYQGANLSFNLSSDMVKDLQAICLEKNTSLYHLILSAINILIHRNTNESDLLIGIETHGREDAQLEHVVGFFVNTVLLRNQIDGQDTLSQVLSEVTKNSLESTDYQAYSLDIIKEDIGLDYEENKNPLFNVEVSYTFDFEDVNELEMVNVGASLYPHETSSTQFDLTISIYEDSDNNVNINLVYSSEIFKEETINLYKSQILRILEGFISDVNQQVNAISFTDYSTKTTSLDVDLKF